MTKKGSAQLKECRMELKNIIREKLNPILETIIQMWEMFSAQTV